MGEGERVREPGRWEAAGVKDEGRAHEPRNAGLSRSCKRQETKSSLEALQEPAPLTPFGLLTSRAKIYDSEQINVCCSRPPRWWCFVIASVGHTLSH